MYLVSLPLRIQGIGALAAPGASILKKMKKTQKSPLSMEELVFFGPIM